MRGRHNRIVPKPVTVSTTPASPQVFSTPHGSAKKTEGVWFWRHTDGTSGNVRRQNRSSVSFRRKTDNVLFRLSVVKSLPKRLKLWCPRTYFRPFRPRARLQPGRRCAYFMARRSTCPGGPRGASKLGGGATQSVSGNWAAAPRGPFPGGP